MNRASLAHTNYRRCCIEITFRFPVSVVANGYRVRVVPSKTNGSGIENGAIFFVLVRDGRNFDRFIRCPGEDPGEREKRRIMPFFGLTMSITRGRVRVRPNDMAAS